MKLSHLLLAALAATSIAGCDGGDDTSSSAATPSRLSGIAAVGAPLGGASVDVQCAAGSALATVNATAAGAWTVDVTGQSFPCLVRVTGGSPRVTLHALATGPGNLNVTPVTDMVVAAAAGTDGKSWLDAHASDFKEAVTALAGRLDAAQTTVRAGLASAGYTLPAGDLLTGGFDPSAGDPYDDLLEALQASLSDAGLTQADLLARAAGTADGGALALPITRYLTATDIASTPALNSSSLSIADGVLTMKTNATAANPVGAFVGGGAGNKAILEVPGLAGTKVADLKNLSLELQLVAHDNGQPGYYGNAPYFNFLIDLNCDSTLPAGASIADARARRRHLIFSPQWDSVPVTSATFFAQAITAQTPGWYIGGNPTLGMSLNGSAQPAGTLSFDLNAYPNACIVDGASADGGVWRDKTADPACDTAAALATSAPATCGRAYKGVLLNLGDSGNLFNLEWKVRKLSVNDKTYRFR